MFSEKDSRVYRARTDLPAIVLSEHKKMISVLKKEYVKDLITSSTAKAYKQERFDIYPGQYGNIFQYCVPFAQAHQKWKLVALTMRFTSTSTQALNSTDTSLGKILFRPVSDPTIPESSTQYEMIQTHGTQVFKSDRSFFYEWPVNKSRGPFTMLSGTQPDNTDVRLYTPGYFEIATVGFQGTSVNLGQLEVIYHIMLILPQMKYLPPMGGFVFSTKYTNADYTNALPWGTGSSQAYWTSGGPSALFTVTTSTQSKITFSRIIKGGRWKIECRWTAGTGVALNAPAIGSYTYVGCTSVSIQSCPANGETNTTTQIELVVDLADDYGDTDRSVSAPTTGWALPSGANSEVVIRLTPMRAGETTGSSAA